MLTSGAGDSSISAAQRLGQQSSQGFENYLKSATSQQTSRELATRWGNAQVQAGKAILDAEQDRWGMDMATYDKELARFQRQRKRTSGTVATLSKVFLGG